MESPQPRSRSVRVAQLSDLDAPAARSGIVRLSSGGAAALRCRLGDGVSPAGIPATTGAISGDHLVWNLSSVGDAVRNPCRCCWLRGRVRLVNGRQKMNLYLTPQRMTDQNAIYYRPKAGFQNPSRRPIHPS